MYQQSIILIKKIKNIYIYKKADIHFLNVTKVNIRGLYPGLFEQGSTWTKQREIDLFS